MIVPPRKEQSGSKEKECVTPERERQLMLVLSVALVASVLGVVYLSFTPDQGTDPYTEFYLLGSEGNASDYPKDLSVGEPGAFTVGIGNHEHRSMRYTLVFQLENDTIDTKTASVERGETREEEYVFVPRSAGYKRLQIHLYRGEVERSSGEPYLSLHLWISVRED